MSPKRGTVSVNRLVYERLQTYCKANNTPIAALVEQLVVTSERETMKHCDDYIDDEAAPPVLRTFLARARSPAHGHLSNDPYPKLFADHEGKRVRVVMASRLGDVGITADLDAHIGYQKRVAVEEISNFKDVP